MHTTKSSEKITPFGGLNFCLEQFHHSGLAGLIDRQLGQRVQTGGFSYSEIIANQLAVFFAVESAPRICVSTCAAHSAK